MYAEEGMVEYRTGKEEDSKQFSSCISLYDISDRGYRAFALSMARLKASADPAITESLTQNARRK